MRCNLPLQADWWIGCFQTDFLEAVILWNGYSHIAAQLIYCMPQLEFVVGKTELTFPLQENAMFERAENKSSLDQVTQYELVLSHWLEKLGVNQKRWHYADAFTAAINYARKSGYLNAKNELTLMGKSFVTLQNLELSEAA